MGQSPMSESSVAHAHQFDDLEQQRQAASLGMWIFLATEVMFFGGMFAGYMIYRWSYGPAFADASNHLDVLLGTINTALLICSSLTMALAVHGAETGSRKAVVICLWLTVVLGLGFLGIKFAEYYSKFTESLIPGRDFHYEGALAPAAEIFFSFYFAMTGMHALHMIIGIALLVALAVGASRKVVSARYSARVEIVGLYWHFVDIVWIFLFPLLYLTGRHL
jgi:cytochrome c oxidase subunit 3